MIRDKLYTKYLSDITSLAEKLDNALNNLPSCSDGETMEESEIRSAIYRAAENLNDAKWAIEHFSKPVKEGRLRKNSYGKFEIDFNQGGTSYPLSCGRSIEIYLAADEEIGRDGGWYSGRVEHNNQGYYFYGQWKTLLYDGMKVRERVD
ncbi:hypothetical protein Ccar_16750 [Clostridium carboxidivorans P7]|uniref:DUF5348 domain-containing protein n=1 Tax=Clostridium carboxidivorans TaxID=217159 RepID=UPI00064E4B0C|nr:DUF5348 domain-containing protein [Clostridium carboxidivorans]AKN32417.1 hypothetical protein Ccar_16750 [Clostridium carboxidivorans P7]